MTKKFRILIVDDQRDVRRVLAMGVQTLNHAIEVLEVPSAEEAMLMSPSRSFDLVVTDVRLPGMSGLELVTRLRKQNADVKIILMTGMTEYHIRREVEKANVFAHFYKPVEMADFLDAVERCLGLVETVFSPPPVVLDTRPLRGVKAESAQPASQPSAPPASAEPASPEPLSLLRQKLSASVAAILEEDGKFVFQAGEHVDLKADSNLLKAVLKAHQGQRSLSQALARQDPEYVLFLDGIGYHLGLAACGPKRLLLVIGTQPFLNNLALGGEALRDTARELHLLLEPPPAPAVVEAAPPPAEPLFPEPLPIPDVDPDAGLLAALANVQPADDINLDDLFGAPADGKKKPASLDDFWDSVAEDTGDIKMNDSHLTYEQAKNMGLAPDKK